MPDLARMRTERYRRLQDQLDAQGVDGLVLLGSSAVAYATGAAEPAQDGDRAALFRTVAVVAKGDSAPHVYTHYDDGLPDDLARRSSARAAVPGYRRRHRTVRRRSLADHFAPGARIGIDHQTHPILRHCRISTGSTRPTWSARPSSPRHRTRWPVSVTRNCSTNSRWSTRARSCGPASARST